MSEPQSHTPSHTDGADRSGTPALELTRALHAHPTGTLGRLPLGRESLGLLVVLIAAVVAFAMFKFGYLRTARFHPERLPLVFAAVCLVSVCFGGIRYSGLHPGFVLLLRGISLSLGFYSAASWTGPGVPPEYGGVLVLTVEVAMYASVAAALISLFRPSFAMIPCAYVLVSKDVTQHLLDLPFLTRIDYLPVVELGMFLALGLVAARILDFSLRPAVSVNLARLIAVPQWRRLSVALLYLSVAIHFGNYFWSAMAKVLLDGGPLVWPLQNETHMLTAAAYMTGHLPIGQSPALSQFVFGAFSHVYSPVNLLTLVAQLLSVVAIVRLRWMIALTLFYDLTHIVIFLATGIFFWKWIVLNTLLVFSLRLVREAEVPPVIRALGPFVVVGATVVFFAARLGWYESRALNDHYFIAETASGAKFRVPSNYFLAASVTVASQTLGSLRAPVFPTRIWGTTFNNKVRLAGESCESQPIGGRVPYYRGSEEQIRRFIRQHHALVVSLADRDGRMPYDWYPHHIWSNPFTFDDFDRLDKRTIVRYWYVVEPKCIAANADSLQPLVLGRHELEIPLD